MPWITKEGRSVDEARDAAVAASGMLTDELEIEVVHEGAKGLFGLGGEPAVVRVRPKNEAQDYRSAFQDDITPAPGSAPARPAPAPVSSEDADDEPAERDPGEDRAEEEAEDDEEVVQRQEAAAALGVEIIGGILERMEIEGEINTRVSGGTVYIEVFGEEMGILIGRNGATLEALQEIVRAGIQRRLKSRQAVVVDVESYWDRRRAAKAERRGGSDRNRGSGGGGSGGGKGGGGRSRGRGRSRGGRRGGRGGQGRREGGSNAGAEGSEGSGDAS